MDPTDQESIDKKLIDLDGTENKSKYGANAILSISEAITKSGAAVTKQPLYSWIFALATKYGVCQSVKMPTPLFNMINGGKHGAGGLTPAASTSQSDILKPTTLTPIATRSTKLGLSRLLAAELRIALNGVSKWWYLVAAGIFLAGLLTPLFISHNFLLAAAWFWPMLIWSKMGCRDQLFDTGQMVRSTQGGFWAQLSMSWLAGFLIALAIGGFIGIRALMSGNFAIVGYWLIGAAFIPSFAVFCGIITGARKLFEVLYTIIFYMGPLNKVPLLDFTGSVIYQDAATSMLITTVGIAVLLALTVVIRKWQILRA